MLKSKLQHTAIWLATERPSRGLLSPSSILPSPSSHCTFPSHNYNFGARFKNFIPVPFALFKIT